MQKKISKKDAAAAKPKEQHSLVQPLEVPPYHTDEIDVPEVMDEGDAASLFQINENMQALNAHRAKLAPQTHPDFDGVTCLDCGTDIPKLRLEMGRIRCTDCQEIADKIEKQYGRS